MRVASMTESRWVLDETGRRGYLKGVAALALDRKHVRSFVLSGTDWITNDLDSGIYLLVLPSSKGSVKRKGNVE